MPTDSPMQLGMIGLGRMGVPFPAFFAAVAARGYTGYCSYEAPNPAAWARDPAEVAREAIEATRAVAR